MFSLSYEFRIRIITNKIYCDGKRSRYPKERKKGAYQDIKRKKVGEKGQKRQEVVPGLLTRLLIFSFVQQRAGYKFQLFAFLKSCQLARVQIF